MLHRFKIAGAYVIAVRVSADIVGSVRVTIFAACKVYDLSRFSILDFPRRYDDRSYLHPLESPHSSAERALAKLQIAITVL